MMGLAPAWSHLSREHSFSRFVACQCAFGGFQSHLLMVCFQQLCLPQSSFMKFTLSQTATDGANRHRGILSLDFILNLCGRCSASLVTRSSIIYSVWPKSIESPPFLSRPVSLFFEFFKIIIPLNHNSLKLLCGPSWAFTSSREGYQKGLLAFMCKKPTPDWHLKDENMHMIFLLYICNRITLELLKGDQVDRYKWWPRETGMG